MSISIVTIQGTDTVSSSRTTINDNFNVLTNEINLIEGYFDPSNGTIDQLVSLNTDNIVVGSTSALLSITGSTFTITSDVSMTGDFNLSGSLIKNHIYSDTLNADDLGTSTDVGSSSTAPEYTVYRVGNSASTATGNFVINLYGGLAGQEIIFAYDSGYTGTVSIVDAGSVPIITSTSQTGSSQIDLSEIGQTVHLLCITNSVGNREWFIIGGNSYQII